MENMAMDMDKKTLEMSTNSSTTMKRPQLQGASNSMEMNEMMSSMSSSIQPAMVLPIEGIRYHLVHYESGKWVHPDGGETNSGDRTRLVFYSPDTKLATHWIFENGQLKHYGSGKFVHPDGGTAGDQVRLELFTGSDGNRTGLRMIEKDSRCYLQHANGRHYVHPNHGADYPDNNTKLVYHSDFRPAIAMAILPAEEDARLISIDFDMSQLETGPCDAVAAQTVIVNNSNTSQECEATVAYTHSLTNTFEFTFSQSAAFSMARSNEVTVTFPGGVGSAGVTTSFSFGVEFGRTQSTTQSTTVGVQSSITVKPTVEPGESLKVVVVTQRKWGDVPYVMHMESAGGIQFDQFGVMKTEYFFDQIIRYENM